MVPDEIAKAFGRRSYVPVVAIVNGRSARTTLVPAGGGSYRLYLNSAQRKGAAADAGDTVGVVLQLDTASRELPIPRELRAALKRDFSRSPRFQQDYSGAAA